MSWRDVGSRVVAALIGAILDEAVAACQGPAHLGRRVLKKSAHEHSGCLASV
jgi:hypothetical protein